MSSSVLPSRQIRDLVSLVRRRYPGWDGFQYPPFAADEVAYKQRAVARAAELLDPAGLAQLLEAGEVGEVLGRLEKLGQATNLLYLRTPRSSDLAILRHPHLDQESFGGQVLELLHGEGPGPERLGRFADYAGRHALPNRWTFPTYFLFLCHPETELFVKPRTIEWFLKLMGHRRALGSVPAAAAYTAVLDQAGRLREALAGYEPRDMVDIQSFIWVCYRESQEQVGRLSPRAQVELDVPQAIYSPSVQTHILREPDNEAFEQVLAEQEESMDTYIEPLAEPLSRIFTSDTHAAWGFELLQDVLQRLGVNDPDDPHVALTLSTKESALRLTYGKWVVLGFRGTSTSRGLHRHIVEMALMSDLINPDLKIRQRFVFDKEEGAPSVALYEVSPELINPKEDHLWKVYQETLDYIVYRFGQWKRSSVRDRHQEEIFYALFNSDWRSRLFKEGIKKEAYRDFYTSLPSSKLLAEAEQENIYPLTQLAAETGIAEVELKRWIRAIERKGQAILYGPPGTGKTFIAERLARYLAGGGDGFVELVQFHPAYTYEEFIQGIWPHTRPDGSLEYQVKPGRFLEFCRRAAGRFGSCVLILDEINRANLARVFGELMYLLEYRGQAIPLAGGGHFAIPANVRLIGTMNTADRSIALVDHALRRRFAFIRLVPDYDLLRRYHADTGFDVAGLVDTLQAVNRQINDPHYEVGITFFLRPDPAGEIGDIWQMEIEPYLEEYFFDRPEQVDEFRWARIEGKVLRRE
ncbi:MAG: AAA family ATPase [Chloroflexi bacterium]|nr:AAA family ATPase [Chloroflexota bacterium]MCI0647692.1 AAA family ATPase [Chloroflexota bacterium]MCI0726579.1 AAA family ATPase [Chloroflexota bacterium]